MFYDDDLIIGRVPKKVKERTKENMEVYNMTHFKKPLGNLQRPEQNYGKHGTMMILENLFLVYIILNIWIFRNIH